MKSTNMMDSLTPSRMKTPHVVGQEQVTQENHKAEGLDDLQQQLELCKLGLDHYACCYGNDNEQQPGPHHLGDGHIECFVDAEQMAVDD